MRIIKREKQNIYTVLTTKELYDITQKFFEERQRVKPFVFYANEEFKKKVDEIISIELNKIENTR